MAWTVLNRFEKGYGSIEHICESWYDGYYSTNDADTYYALTCDVCIRWWLEQLGVEDVGRVIPKDYVFFMGDGYNTNYFCAIYHKSSLDIAKANAWGWSLPDPYTK